jgi:peptidoglycan/LPS O-acetylase OafA/YrhL
VRAPSSTRRAGPPRWGWRALGFLGLAFVSLVTAQLQGEHTTGTMGCLLFGILGAVYCSAQGVMNFARLDWMHRRQEPGDS